MNYLDRLAEAHIRTAAEHGVFDNLRGAGKPLPPDEAQHVPRELRAGYRMLKNAGFVPPEVEQARIFTICAICWPAWIRTRRRRMPPGAACAGWKRPWQPAGAVPACSTMRNTGPAFAAA